MAIKNSNSKSSSNTPQASKKKSMKGMKIVPDLITHKVTGMPTKLNLYEDSHTKPVWTPNIMFYLANCVLDKYSHISKGEKVGIFKSPECFGPRNIDTELDIIFHPFIWNHNWHLAIGLMKERKILMVDCSDDVSCTLSFPVKSVLRIEEFILTFGHKARKSALKKPIHVAWEFKKISKIQGVNVLAVIYCVCCSDLFRKSLQDADESYNQDTKDTKDNKHIISSKHHRIYDIDEFYEELPSLERYNFSAELYKSKEFVLVQPSLMPEFPGNEMKKNNDVTEFEDLTINDSDDQGKTNNTTTTKTTNSKVENKGVLQPLDQDTNKRKSNNIFSIENENKKIKIMSSERKFKAPVIKNTEPIVIDIDDEEEEEEDKEETEVKEDKTAAEPEVEAIIESQVTETKDNKAATNDTETNDKETNDKENEINKEGTLKEKYISDKENLDKSNNNVNNKLSETNKENVALVEIPDKNRNVSKQNIVSDTIKEFEQIKLRENKETEKKSHEAKMISERDKQYFKKVLSQRILKDTIAKKYVKFVLRKKEKQNRTMQQTVDLANEISLTIQSWCHINNSDRQLWNICITDFLECSKIRNKVDFDSKDSKKLLDIDHKNKIIPLILTNGNVIFVNFNVDQNNAENCAVYVLEICLKSKKSYGTEGKLMKTAAFKKLVEEYGFKTGRLITEISYSRYISPFDEILYPFFYFINYFSYIDKFNFNEEFNDDIIEDYSDALDDLMDSILKLNLQHIKDDFFKLKEIIASFRKIQT